MKVILNNTVYEMTTKQCSQLLNVCKQRVERGIYAIEQRKVVELKNEPYKDEKSLKKAITDYTKKGFKVYYNE